MTSTRMIYAGLWVWLHLLQFTVSNQTLNVEEDSINKKYRPLPSGDITLRHALLLRWSLLPFCWLVSHSVSSASSMASISISILTIVHNELGFHGKHWTIRNLLNGLGIASFELGAVVVACEWLCLFDISMPYLKNEINFEGGRHHRIDDIVVRGVISSACILATTIHAQDFKDVDGDIAVGRKTLPIVSPRMSRHSMLIGLPVCSLGIAYVWELQFVPCCALFCLAVLIGWRYVLHKDVESDQTSYLLYNVSCGMFR